MAKQYPYLKSDATYPPSLARESESTAALLSRLVEEVSTLFRKEVTLAKAELLEAVAQWMSGAVRLATGGVMLFSGVLVLLAAAVLVLGQFMASWLAALVVGGTVSVVGFVLVQNGKKKLEPWVFRPERTQNALRKDKEMVNRRAV